MIFVIALAQGLQTLKQQVTVCLPSLCSGTLFLRQMNKETKATRVSFVPAIMTNFCQSLLLFLLCSVQRIGLASTVSPDSLPQFSLSPPTPLSFPSPSLFFFLSPPSSSSHLPSLPLPLTSSPPLTPLLFTLSPNLFPQPLSPLSPVPLTLLSPLPPLPEAVSKFCTIHLPHPLQFSPPPDPSPQPSAPRWAKESF